MIRKYAIIPLENFTEEMIKGAEYPVVIEQSGYKMLEYNDQPAPTGEGWILFSGDDSNIKCADFLRDNSETEPVTNTD